MLTPKGFDAAELAAAGPVLDWLSIGLAHLLSLWLSWLPPVGAILALSLSVKLLLLPLSRLAERWQVQVNRLHSRLQTEQAALKRNYRGEALHEQVLALYRTHRVTPLYPLKGLLGVAIQVPLFFAAYHALAACLDLQGVSWLWINDLAENDRWLSLPLHLPWLGDSLNLLPLLMTAINLASARLYVAEGLQGVALVAQRRQLYLLALVFMLLLYPFPAALVLYWSLNNLLDLLRIIWLRWHRQPGDSAALPSENR